MSLPQTGAGGMTIAREVYDRLPRAFVDYYQETFRGTRMIYGHWSGGPYTRAVGAYHRQISVKKPLELDELLDKYLDARNRRVGGTLTSIWHQVEQMKKSVELQVFDNAPWDRDLEGHTRHRDANSIAIAMMCGRGARLNDLGMASPLKAQVRSLVGLVAQACVAVDSPVERFMTASEAADNLDYPEGEGPAPPCGFRSTREVWDLEAWLDLDSEVLAAPLQAARSGWARLGDWVREQALRSVVELTRGQWEISAAASKPPS